MLISALQTVAFVIFVLLTSHDVPAQAAAGRILRVGGLGNYRALQDAITDARDGDTIQVAQGLYNENVRLTASKSVTLQGGWDPGFTSRSNDRSLTIVDGGGRGSVLYFSPGTSGNISIVIEGFTLRNGKAERGGGIRAEALGRDARLSLTLTRNSILNNSSSDRGGGVCVYASSLEGVATAVLSASDNLIQGNASEDTGGGVALWSIDKATLTANLTGNHVIANRASQAAGGIWINSAHEGAKTEVAMTRNVVSDNTGPSLDGGGIAAYTSGSGASTNLSLVGNAIVANSAGYGGGAFFYPWGTGAVMEATITDNLVANNRGQMMFGGLVLGPSNAATGIFRLTGNTITQNTSGNNNPTAGLTAISGSNEMPLGTDTSRLTVESRNDIVWGNEGAPHPLDLAIFAYSTSDPVLFTASYSAFGAVDNHLGTFTTDHCTIGSLTPGSGAGAGVSQVGPQAGWTEGRHDVKARGVGTLAGAVTAPWPVAFAQSYAVSTVAGSGDAGTAGDGGPATAAQFLLPGAVAADGNGSVFVVDVQSHRVRKIAADGTISTVAGTGTPGFAGDGGAAKAAQLCFPHSVALDATGNLFIADTFNNRIRKVSIAGVISTVAGNGLVGFSGDSGPATNARLAFPYFVAVDRANGLLIADTLNHRIRKVAPDGTITTVAGNGTSGISGDGSLATAAQLSLPGALATDNSGAFFVVGLSDSRVRKVDGSGIIATVAGSSVPGFGGDGSAGKAAMLSFPRALVADSTGDLFLADTYNNRIRKVAASGTITTVAGENGPGFAGDGGFAPSVQFNGPTGLAVDARGNLFVVDAGNLRIRKLTVVAPGCRFELGAADALAPPGGVDGSVAVTTTPECAWTAASNVSWIKLTAGAANTGSGTVRYNVAPNAGGLRTGAVNIAGQVFTITQAAKGATAPLFLASGVVNAASGIGGGVSPGEFVSIFGAGLGPSLPVLATSMEKGLGGTKVFFKGIEAFVTYTSSGQVNTLVPYGISDTRSVDLQIEFDAMRSQGVTLSVVESATGIFTRDASGSGAAVVVNQDGSMNGPDTPASRGEIIAFWATGQGQTDPPGIDGKQPVAPLFPRPSLPVTVVVGGVPVPSSDVLFAGMVYAGVMQVNVRLPGDIGSGPQPIVLRVGNASSRPGVTVSVADRGRVILDLDPLPEKLVVRKIVDNFLLGVGTTDPRGCVSPDFLRTLRIAGLNYFLPFTTWSSVAGKDQSYMGDPCPGRQSIAWLSKSGARLNGHCLLFLFNQPYVIPSFAYGRPFAAQKTLLERFIREAVSRLPEIEMWTLNEPVNQNALNWSREQIYDAFVSASQWIRETNPKAKIMLNMIPIPNNWSGLSYDPNQVLDDLLARGLKPDIIGIELYPSFAGAPNSDENGYPKLEWVRSRVDLFRKYNLPILFSEVAVPGATAGRDQFSRQADWAEAFLRQCHNDKAIIGATWYFVRDDDFLPSGGLANDDYTLRPVADRILKLAGEWNPATTYTLAGGNYLDLVPGDYDVVVDQQVYRVHITSGTTVRLSNPAAP
jgi:uncharacterized protein (TIGR03437 family)